MFRFQKIAASRTRALTATVSAVALLAAMPSARPAQAADAGSAQAAPVQTAQAAQAQTAQAPAVEEVVVTGSRIVRNGYQAPTPVSVLSVDELQAQGPQNIADAINDMPEFAASVTPHAANSSTGNGTVGMNILNLRAMGPNRTLVLMDGQRIVPSNENGSSSGGAVDANVIPNGLVSRVDVVTGGASAAYGSDALSGVVNFVLDHNFTGVKGSIGGGVTTFGDDRNWLISLTAGSGFANDRGHVLVSGDASYSDGVRGNPRPYAAVGEQIISNPLYTATSGQPEYLVVPNVGLSVAAPGGLIVSGPLKGVAFGPGGTPYQFLYGPNGYTGTEMQGGDWQVSRTDLTSDLDAELSRQTIFTRLSYDIADNFEVYGDLSWVHTYNFSHNAYPYQLGSDTILAGNPFIPAAIAAQMTALHLTSLTMGTDNTDLQPARPDNDHYYRRHVLGADGKVDAFGSNWSWDAYYEESTSRQTLRILTNLLTPNFLQAINAVVNPANGAIVCASSLTNPGNGCVPFNIFGSGVNSQAAANYVDGQSYGYTYIRQDALGATASGEPFSTWAGPVSLAFGAEWRYEGLSATSDPLDQAGSFFSGNYKASLGHYSVGEGFVETVLPLAKNTAWAKALDLNAAVRFTDYSTSGYVTTWKIGGNYSPIDDIRFRVTESRDIRAPNLGDLYLGGRSNTGFLTDPFTNTSPAVLQVTHGNPTLVPEVANTTGAGFVLSPTFLPGFNASFDYYNIRVGNAISSLSAQQIINQCYDGVSVLCPLIVRTNGLITQVNISPANVLSQSTKGYDVEASYKLGLSSLVSSWEGDLSFRGLGTRVISIKTINNASVPPVLQGAGVNADGGGDGTIPLQAPKFRYELSATYTNNPVDVTLTMHGISAGVYNYNWVTCASGCPAATTANPTSNLNSIAGVTWFDLSINYKIIQNGGNDVELFFITKDLTNQGPPLIGGAIGTGLYQAQANGDFYDDLRIGRMFQAGVRFKM